MNTSKRLNIKLKNMYYRSISSYETRWLNKEIIDLDDNHVQNILKKHFNDGLQIPISRLNNLLIELIRRGYYVDGKTVKKIPSKLIKPAKEDIYKMMFKR